MDERFEKIKNYKRLLDAGVITEQDFNDKKQELLFGENESGNTISEPCDLKTVPSEPTNDIGHSEQDEIKTKKKRPKSGKKKVLIPVIAAAAAAIVIAVLFFIGVIGFGGHVTQKVTQLEAGQTYTLDDMFEVDDGYKIDTEETSYRFYVGEEDGGKIKISSEENLKKDISLTVVSERGHESTEEFTFNIVDTKGPEIITKSESVKVGEKPDYEKMVSFKDSGVNTDGNPVTKTVFESDFGGNVTIDSSAVKTTEAGKYKVIVKATDAFDNTTEAEFTLEVVAPPPEVEATVDSPVETPYYEESEAAPFSKETLYGKWDITEMSSDDTSISAEAYRNSTGSDMGYIVFNSNGTGQGVIGDNSFSLTWKLSGYDLTINDGVEDFRGNINRDGSIYFYNEGGSTTLTIAK